MVFKILKTECHFGLIIIFIELVIIIIKCDNNCDNMYPLSYFKRAILSPHLEKTNISLVRCICFYHMGYFWKYNLFVSDTFLCLLNSDHLLESWLYFYFYLHGKYQYSHYWYVCIIRKVLHPYLAVMLFSVYFLFDICNSVIIRSMYLFSSHLPIREISLYPDCQDEWNVNVFLKKILKKLRESTPTA